MTVEQYSTIVENLAKCNYNSVHVNTRQTGETLTSARLSDSRIRPGNLNLPRHTPVVKSEGNVMHYRIQYMMLVSKILEDREPEAPNTPN